MGALIVFGYGPGISHATAERFGREGYSLALVGRKAERLAEGASRTPGLFLDERNYGCCRASHRTQHRVLPASFSGRTDQGNRHTYHY
jgi:NAD(P)-dependent dehydrogenase (short-subunit alcohol dehydrogenase family)